MTRLLEDFAKMKNAQVLLADPGKDTALDAKEAFASSSDVSPRDAEGRLIASPTARVVPLDEDALRGRYFKARPAGRVPLEPQAQTVQQPAPQQMPQAQPAGDDEGFDWKRGLMGLTHGIEGMRTVDAQRAQQAQSKLAQQEHAQQSEMRGFDLDEKRRAAVMARQAADPTSQLSANVREETAASMSAMGEMYPNLKPTISGFLQKLGGMSATEMMSAREQFKGLFDAAQKFQHDRANEALTKEKLGLQREGVAAQWAAANAAREAKEQDKDDKAVVEYGKEANPIDMNTKTLQEVRASDVKTGWLPDKFHKVRQFIGMKDDNWDTAEGALASVSNEIRNGLFGASLTPGEKAEFLKMLPDMSMPRATFDAKMDVVLKRMAEKKKLIDASHPRATRALGKNKAAPSNSKLELARQALTDPEATPEDKAAAKRILAQHGQ